MTTLEEYKKSLTIRFTGMTEELKSKIDMTSSKTTGKPKTTKTKGEN